MNTIKRSLKYSLSSYVFIFCFPFLHIDANELKNIKKYILSNYTKTNEEDFIISKNRFKITKFKIEFKNNGQRRYNFDDGIFLFDIKTRKVLKFKENPLLQKYYKIFNILKFPNYQSFNIEDVYYHKTYGQFIFYNYLKYNQKSSEKLNDDVIWSYGFINTNFTKNPKIEFTKEDTETGTYSKDLWDIFKFGKNEYLLLDCNYYESDYFELYKIVKDKTVFITKIEYGGH